MREYVQDILNTKIYKYKKYGYTGEPFSTTIIKSLGATKY